MHGQDDDQPDHVQDAGAPYAVQLVPPAPAPVPAPARRVAATPERRRAPPREGGKVLGQPGFVLHSYPYKETSLIVDLFTRDFGRIGVVAKGAKRPLSKLRGVLQTFQPLSVSFSGKSELRTLIDAACCRSRRPPCCAAST